MTMSAACAQPLAARKSFGSKAKLAAPTKTRAVRRNVVTQAARDGPVIIGLAADSGCGKSTFMRRMTSLFGGKATPPGRAATPTPTPSSPTPPPCFASTITTLTIARAARSPASPPLTSPSRTSVREPVTIDTIRASSCASDAPVASSFVAASVERVRNRRSRHRFFSPLHREALFLRAYPDAAQLARIRRDLCFCSPPRHLSPPPLQSSCTSR